MTRILHTSDWHIGRTLYGRKRHDEHEAFLNWLSDTILKERVDTLIIAGDIFDTIAPGTRSQELYYQFLRRTAASPCRHVVATGGNHDSPSFLDAPRELLRMLDVHVLGAASGTVEEEVLILRDKGGIPELIVCAVPYLRDRDVRAVDAGESMEDKERKLREGISRHYADVAVLAEKKRSELGNAIPVIGMGHLFAQGGLTVDGDGVRELYVGSLAHVDAGGFPEAFDYLALGHLHVPQAVKGSQVIRYSGSPLPMGFGEAKQHKSVCLVEFSGKQADVRLIEVPVFQHLESVKGNWEALSGRIVELSAIGSQTWLEVIYDGDEIMPDLRVRLDTLIEGTGVEILRVTNNRVIDRVLGQIHDGETLDGLDQGEVFARCLLAHKVPEEQCPGLGQTYREIVSSIHETDVVAG
jgi:exonuclease SbcD